ncbi:hypothetical protein O3G_MSEX007509 [Manduca sexta]|uniref:Ubiquitin carboxyl-terminal hydrolase n=1 Tax=Manduca sexta TaxID=7130 RepID=A0A922CNB1_MANSE|nr:hypothetical protein O3G_MSEX007509 [Manduca sexta]
MNMILTFRFDMEGFDDNFSKQSVGDWCLIESDPGVFTQLIRKFGAKGVQVEELWTLEDSIFENLRPVHGLIFLFKHMQVDHGPPQVFQENVLERIYFAKQVINNACATQAVLSILMNCRHPDLVLGPELQQLREFSMSFDPRMRGLTLSNSTVIRNAHNSMAQQTLFELEHKAPSKDDVQYHFISYMPIDGRLYEMDGLRDGPRDYGAISPQTDWLDLVRPIIMDRINYYTEDEIHFNLMAVVSDRKMIYERQLQELLEDERRLNIDTGDPEIPRLRMLIEYEEIKARKYKLEMARRRHNYFPFLISLFKVLGREKKLIPMFEKAKSRVAKKGAKKLKV